MIEVDDGFLDHAATTPAVAMALSPRVRCSSPFPRPVIRLSTAAALILIVYRIVGLLFIVGVATLGLRIARGG